MNKIKNFTLTNISPFNQLSHLHKIFSYDINEYLSRWSKARPSTSWIATVGPESARGPWSIARKTGFAADNIAR